MIGFRGTYENAFEMLEKLILKLRQSTVFLAVENVTETWTRKFAWVFAPFFSLLRFRKVRYLGDRVARWSVTPENDVEGLVLPRIPRTRVASFELRVPSNSYGHARVLKQYAGLPDVYPIKVNFSHGVNRGEVFLDPASPKTRAYDFTIPVFLAWGRYEEEVLARLRPENKVFVIGAPFLYADNFFSEEYVREEKKRLGRNLLVFPSHSAKTSVAHYDIDEFLTSIESFRNDFDAVRVCMYWTDVQNGTYKFYRDRGFECVTAGYDCDVNFVSRLKGLLSVSDAVLTNNLGTHVGYCVAMDKPVRIIDKTNAHTNKGLEANVWRLLNDERYISPGYRRLEEMLTKNEPWTITQELRDAVEPFWGLREKKTKEELRRIFREAEELFAKSPCRGTFFQFR